MPPVLYLIDGHALAYRTYYAITRGSSSSFATRSGEPTAGVFGFTSVLLRLLEQERPEYLIVVFDTGRTFRDDLYSEYKATREKMPDDLVIQIERVRQMVDAFNIPRIEVEGYEADDVLGSLARQAVAAGLGVKIITGDRDLLQLVADRIAVSLPGKGLSDSKDYLRDDVIAAMGVPPEQVVDLKALVGDKSDNIPGVAGIGDKTAVSLLQAYQNLDEIYAHLDDLPAGTRKKLEAGRESAYLSQKLATIVQELEVPLDLEKAKPANFNPQEVEALFRELEFRTLLSRLNVVLQLYGKTTSLQANQQLSMFPEAKRVAEIQPVATGYSCQTALVKTVSDLQALVARLSQAEIISFDTETTSTDPMKADMVGISLSVKPGEGYYIPVGHRDATSEQLPLQQVLEALRPALTDPAIPKVGHNIKYDFMMFARYGLRVTPLAFDTMIAEWVVHPDSRNLGLKNLAWVRQDIKMTSIDELIGKGKNQISMADVPVDAAAAYAAADAEVVLRLVPELRAELEASQGMTLYNDLEMPLVSVLADMEMAGVSLDTEYLSKMSNDLEKRINAIEVQVFNTVGERFNINSTQQLSVALFEKLRIAPPDRTARTASGHYSTAADVLEFLRGKHPVVDWVLEHRELSKLKSAYVDALPTQVNPYTGRVHTSYNQTGSVTGRIASSEPNLQNIPIRTETGRLVRHAFVAAPGNLLLSVDYSQVELRIVAHMADDQAMLEAFRAGQDIHATTAAAVYGIPLDQVNKDQRRRAKGINFGLIYGMSAFGLTRATDLTLAESENFMQAYFKQFPGVKGYLDQIRRLAADQGYVETLMGRRRYFPALKNQTNQALRNREEREAINAPIQGTAADIMKVAMLHVPPALVAAGLKCRMLLQVHDELVLECPQTEIDETVKVVRRAMENAFELKVPLSTEARYGLNWGALTTVIG